MTRIKVLWIEDGAFAELSLMSGPIYVSGKYDLVTALDATEGLHYLAAAGREFDVTVVDVRLPPGDDPDFVKLYNEKGESRVASRLGLSLLDRVLNHGEKDKIPEHHAKHREKFAIFTAESREQVEEDMRKLGLDPIVYHQKTVRNSKTKLRDIIDDVWRRRTVPSGGE